MVWLYTAFLWGRKRVLYSFKCFLPAFTALREGGGVRFRTLWALPKLLSRFVGDRTNDSKKSGKSGLLLFFLFRTHNEGLAESCTCTMYNCTYKQCWGSGSAFIWLSWIRIRFRIGNADPDSGAWKLTKIYEWTLFPAFQKGFCTFVGMFFDLLPILIMFIT